MSAREGAGGEGGGGVKKVYGAEYSQKSNNNFIGKLC